MSAALEFSGYLCWGSNGMKADYLEQMANAAIIAASPEDELTRWLNYQHQNFYPGAVIVLASMLLGDEVVSQFIALLDETTKELLSGDQFSEIGKRWLCEEIPRLKSPIRREE